MSIPHKSQSDPTLVYWFDRCRQIAEDLGLVLSTNGNVFLLNNAQGTGGLLNGTRTANTVEELLGYLNGLRDAIDLVPALKTKKEEMNATPILPPEHREQLCSIALLRIAFETTIKASDKFKHSTPLSIMEVNGKFDHYMNPGTDTMWLGFALGYRSAVAKHLDAITTPAPPPAPPCTPLTHELILATVQKHHLVPVCYAPKATDERFKAVTYKVERWSAIKQDANISYHWRTCDGALRSSTLHVMGPVTDRYIETVEELEAVLTNPPPA